MTYKHVIDLRELMYNVLKKWRIIILIGIIVFALLFCLKLAVGLYNTLNDNARNKAQEKYEKECQEYNETGEQLKAEIDDLNTALERQIEYNDKSILMKIDSTKKYEGVLNIYIDSKFKIDPELSFQNTDLTGRLVNAYYSYFSYGELYNYIIKNTDLVSEIQYLTEIMEVTADASAAAITIKFAGQSELDVQELMQITKDGLEQKYSDIRSAVGDHEYAFILESTYTMVDSTLENKQLDSKKKVTVYENQISDKNKEYSDWSQAKPSQEYGYRRTIISALKAGAIGGAISVLIVLIYYAVAFIHSNKLNGDIIWDDLQIPVLGTVYYVTNQKTLQSVDRIIDKLFGFGKYNIGFSKSCELAVANLSIAQKKHNTDCISIISIANDKITEQVIETINKDNQKPFINFGNILVDSQSVNKLVDNEKVILLAQNGRNTVNEVERVKMLLHTWGIELLGTIVVKQ